MKPPRGEGQGWGSGGLGGAGGAGAGVRGGFFPPGGGRVVRLGAARMLGGGVRPGCWAHGVEVGRRDVAVHQVNAREVGGRRHGGRQRGTRRLPAEVLAVRVAVGFVGVCVGGQEPEAALQGLDPGQLEVRPVGEHFELMDGQGDAKIAAPGVDRGQPPGVDPRHQPGDLEKDGQSELEGVHPVIVDQDANRGLLDGGDPVRGQADQFPAARYVQRAPGRREDVPVLAPAGYEDLHQVDLQQADRDYRRLADGGFPGHPRQPPEGSGRGPARGHDVPGQRLMSTFGRAEEQIGGGDHAVRPWGRHRLISSSVVMMAAGRGSRRTTYVSGKKTSWESPSAALSWEVISWRLTGLGGPISGTALTSAGGAAGGRFRRRLRSRRAVSAPAAAMATAATAASETTTCLGTLVVAEARTAVARGWADASPDAPLTVPLPSTAVTTK